MKNNYSSKVSNYLRFVLLIAFTTLSLWSAAQNCSVNSGVPQGICENDQLFLHGSTSGLEAVGNEPTWSQVGGPTVTIVATTDLNTEITNFSGGNIYTFRLSSTCLDGSLVYQGCCYYCKCCFHS